MDDVARKMLGDLAKISDMQPEMRRMLEHLYRVGRLVVVDSSNTNYTVRCRCTFTFGPVPSLDELVAPYNDHLATEHRGEQIERLPPHPVLRDVIYQPPPRN